VYLRAADPILEDARYRDGYRWYSRGCRAGLNGARTRHLLVVSFRRGLLSDVCYGGAGLASVVLNLNLVPRFGYWQAGAVNLIHTVFLLALAWAVSRSLFPWPFPVVATLRVLTAAGVMGFVVWIAIRRDRRSSLTAWDKRPNRE